MSSALRWGSLVRSRSLPSRPVSALTACLSMRSSPPGGRQLVRAGDRLAQLGQQPPADGGVAFGSPGVVADDEPLVVADLDFLDAQVVGGLGVAALPLERGTGLGRPGAQPLPDDVVVVTFSQPAAVFGAGEA